MGTVGEIGNRRDPGGVYDTLKGKGRKVESKSVLGVVDREWALCMRHQISLPHTTMSHR